MGISTSAAVLARFSLLRVNTTSRGLSSRGLLRSAAPPLSKPRSSPAFCAVLFFIPFSRSSSRALIALSRENPPSFRAVSLSSLYSLFFFPSPSPSAVHAFLKGEGARPGAAVSNKYDTGIGYKETINHPSGRE